jgi:hypothetical protein
VNRVKLSWLLPVLGVLALGGVFLRCVDKEVDEPMRWRNALDIPFSFSMPLDASVTEAVHGAMNGSISTAVPNLKSDGQDSLISIILGDTALIGQVMEPDFDDILSQFIKNDSTVRELLEDNKLKVDDVAADVAKQVDDIQQEVGKVFKVPFLLPAQNLPALNSGMDFIDSVIFNQFFLINKTPLKFRLYVLFFADDESSPVFAEGEDRPVNHINDDDDDFLNFIRSDSCKPESGCINLTGPTGLQINKEKTSMPKFPKEMNDWLREFIVGTKPLVWRGMAEIDGEPGDVLKALGGGDREYSIGAELNIRIVGTNRF